MKKNLNLLLALLFLGFSISSCSKDDDEQYVNPKTYVLVHGAWQAAYAWRSVQTSLERAGNKVIVVELPAHGTDQTPPQNVTLDAYRDKVADIISKESGKVVLVGHSLGGMVISAAAEKVPEKIEKLIYVAAFVPQNGQTVFDLAGMDQASMLTKSLIPSADQLTFDLIRSNITDIFLQDGTQEVKDLLLKNYRVEPAIPFTNKITLTGERFGKVAKYYIRTLKDQALTPTLQNSMIKTAGIDRVYQIDTGHSPFMTKPDSLAIILNSIGSN